MLQIAKDIKNNAFKQVYLLFGEERYLCRQYKNKLWQALNPNDDTMNTHVYEGKDISVGEIIDLAETLPFLAEHRVIFITDSGLFKSGGEQMAEYMASINESTIFVFTESAVDKRSKLYKAVQAHGYVAELNSPTESDLKKWIQGVVRRENKAISEQTVQYLIAKVGTEMDNIQMELEKVICYCIDREVITNSDIDAVCTIRLTNHVFDMLDCIAEGKSDKALSLYYDLIALKEQPMGILFLIAKHCNRLLQVRDLKNAGYNNTAIATAIGVPPFSVPKYVNQASKFKASTLRNAVEKCVEAEEAVKQGRMNDLMSVEVLILTVLL